MIEAWFPSIAFEQSKAITATIEVWHVRRKAIEAELDILRTENAKLRSTLIDIEHYCDDSPQSHEVVTIRNTVREAAWTHG
jgi:hypothetical protein